MVETTRTALYWLTGILVGVLISGMTWTMNKTAVMGARVEVIEDTRFSTKDGLELEMRMRQEMRGYIDEIKDCLNDIQKSRECK